MMSIWIAGILAYALCVYIVVTDSDERGEPKEQIF